MNQLCLYLETLHQKGESIDQHTILLITAYVKINAPERLQAFLDKHTSMFDIDEALKVNKIKRIKINIYCLHILGFTCSEIFRYCGEISSEAKTNKNFLSNSN